MLRRRRADGAYLRVYFGHPAGEHHQEDPEEVVDIAVETIEYIKKHGCECLFSPMDATRTDVDYLIDS